ncbi:MAG: NYN domain-containing protein [Pseudomonadota bacterium]
MVDAPKRLAVLIDGENMPAKFADAIFDEIARFGEASVRRLYGDIDEGGVRPWMEKLSALAITPCHQPKNTVGKNASDIALVIDAMDILHAGRHDGFVLISSDSDFTKLAQRIREEGIDVWGMGEGKTPESFRVACKQFITVENLVSDSEASARSAKKQDINHAYQILKNVISGSTDDDGWVALGPLGSQLMQRYPDFDPRSFGHSRLLDLVNSIDKFEIKRIGTQPHARLKP